MSQAHAAPAPPAVTPHMLQVLRWVSNAREGSTLNAALYADAIARCLALRLLRLDGGLSSARLSLTDLGRDLLAVAP